MKLPVLAILIALFIAGCIMPGAPGSKADAIAVWQHQGATWDIHYALWDHDAKTWYVPGAGRSAPIATDAGDDHDPDVSSNDNSAIAVWQKQTGGSTIYYSSYSGNWTAPAKLSSSDQDTDPTVAMDQAGNALAVWVSQGKFLSYSYYTKAGGWSPPGNLPTAGIAKVSLPELAFNTKDGNYYLVFTGGDAKAYLSVYSSAGGWSSPIESGDNAVIDNNVPTGQRTGIAAAEGKNEVTAVYPGNDGNVYSFIPGKAARNFNDGMMPDDAYDSADVPNGAFNRAEDLFHQKDVDDPSSAVVPISAAGESDDRPSLIFVRGRSDGLVVWWSKATAPAQISYSYYAGGSWSAPAEIDPSLSTEMDRNPAVTPLRTREVSGGPYCGDGKLNLPFEMCEAGIACANPNQVCNLANCRCEEPAYNYTCSDNSIAIAFGGAPLAPPGAICKDDCPAIFGAGYKCDAVTCTCGKAPPPPKNVTCAINTRDNALGIPSSFKPGMLCKDDCKSLGAEFTCDAKTCLCQRPPENLTCAGNTKDLALGIPSSFKPGMLCKDDCKSLGDGYVCDAQKCVCNRIPANDYYCAGNTFVSSLTGANTFNPLINSCIDNCDALGEGYTCDAVSCVCNKKEDKSVSCYARKIESIGSGFGLPGPAPFNPAAMVCRDDCAANSPDLYCDGTTCICEPKTTSYCTSGNVEDIFGFSSKFDPKTMRCEDNCKELGADYVCEPQSCKCEYKPKDYSCVDNSLNLDIFTGNSTSDFRPGVNACKDDCERLGANFKCNAQTCQCDPQPVKCAGNTIDTIETGKSDFNWLAFRCEDNCKELGPGLECNPFSCLCEKTYDPKVYCAANTDDAYVNDALGRTQTPRFNASSQQCIDNCAEIFNSLAVCDPVSCYCVPAPGEEISCAGHTDYVSVTDINKFNKSSMQCSDDCKEFYGQDSFCNPTSCTCSKTPPEPVWCSKNTVVPNVAGNEWMPGLACKDNCVAALGSGYICDPEGCFCKNTRTVTPRCGDGYVSAPGVPGGGSEECDVGFGFYQPKDASGKPYNTPDTCPPPTMCDAASCKCVQPVTESFCGDGVISSPAESCDIGSASTNKCSEGLYCNQCQCVKLETSPRCGDGKISVESGEQCDGGSVTTNICQQGYKCYTPECICMPLEGSSQCGDGTVVAPEECDHGNTFTAKCPSGKSCSSCQCVDYDDLSHTECDYAHGQCVSVQGQGQNECTSDSQCVEESICGNGNREGSEQCDGNDDLNCDSGQSCNQDCQCQTTATITYHFECQQNACVQVQGPGSSECNSDDDCVPPVVNCPAYCEGQGYSQSLGGGYSSSGQCQSAAQESAEQCTTKCVYSKFYSTSNAAGTTTCCCKQVEVFQCSDCPGQNPQCPDPEVVCPANQP